VFTFEIIFLGRENMSLGLLSHIELQEMTIGRIYPPTSRTRSGVVHHQKVKTTQCEISPPFKKPSLGPSIKLTESYFTALVHPNVGRH
jgi:hypothetical protein